MTGVPGGCRKGAILKETRGLLVTSPESGRQRVREKASTPSPTFLSPDLQPVLEARRQKRLGNVVPRDKEQSRRVGNGQMLGTPSFQVHQAGRSQCAYVFSPLCPSPNAQVWLQGVLLVGGLGEEE